MLGCCSREAHITITTIYCHYQSSCLRLGSRYAKLVHNYSRGLLLASRVPRPPTSAAHQPCPTALSCLPLASHCACLTLSHPPPPPPTRTRTCRYYSKWALSLFNPCPYMESRFLEAFHHPSTQYSWFHTTPYAMYHLLPPCRSCLTGDVPARPGWTRMHKIRATYLPRYILRCCFVVWLPADAISVVSV